MKIIKADELPLGEEVFLKKDWTGWRVVEPIIHPDTKKFLWKNFVSRKGLLFLAVIIILLLTFYRDVHAYMEIYNNILKDPCSYCYDKVISGFG